MMSFYSKRITSEPGNEVTLDIIAPRRGANAPTKTRPRDKSDRDGPSSSGKRRSVILSLLVLLSCQAPVTTGLNPNLCPLGTKQQPARARQILEKLRAPEISEASLCFGELWPSRVITNGPYLLDESASDEALAARLGHLREHQRLAALFDTPNTKDCERWVTDVLAAEASAYAIELQLRRELGVLEGGYAFEGEFWRGKEAGEAIILRYLQEHPSGGGGIDALGAGYTKRCQGESAESQ